MYTVGHANLKVTQLGGSSGGVPTENTSLAYGSITTEYEAISPSGVKITIRRCFNMETQTAC